MITSKIKQHAIQLKIIPQKIKKEGRSNGSSAIIHYFKIITFIDLKICVCI